MDKKIMESKFFTFIKPFLSFIDNGEFYRKPFRWFYALMGIANLLLPLIALIVFIDKGLFRFPAKEVILVLISIAIMGIASWISFQLWWDRKSKILDISKEGEEFVATPIFSHLIQTLGEWLGTWVAIVGFGLGLLFTIIESSISRIFGVSGGISIIIMPLAGFFIIIVTRFLAEQFRALTSIANNTRKK